MGLIRSMFSLAVLGAFVLVGLTVPIGERTLFGHVSNIWGSSEAQELVDGVKDSSGPLVDRVKRGVEAGISDESATEQGDTATEQDGSATEHGDKSTREKIVPAIGAPVDSAPTLIPSKTAQEDTVQ